MSTIIELNPQYFARTQQGSCLMTATDTETGIKEPVALFEGRASGRTAVGRNGLIYNVLPYEPAFTLVDGQMALSEEPTSTNLYLNSETPSTQNVTTLSSEYTVSFYGIGQIDFTGSYVGSLIGTASNERVSITFTATAGTLTSTVTDTEKIQCENLPYSTSYIVTTGATTTRLGATGVKTPDVSKYIDSGNFDLEFSSSALSDSLTNRILSLSDGTNDNRVNFYYRSISNQILLRSEFNDVSSTDIESFVVDTTIIHDFKISVVNGDTIELFIDGDSKGSTTIDTPLVNSLKYLKLSSPSGVDPFYSNIYNIKITS